MIAIKIVPSHCGNKCIPDMNEGDQDMPGRESIEGHCTCGRVRYRMNKAPMFVHCCHCRWCQRETGTAFALNGLVEAREVTLLKGQVEIVDTPSNSGKGQRIARCPDCRVALWSNYAGGGDRIHFIRIGTLDHPDAFPPDVHIYTSTKQPWVNLDGGAPAVAEYYRRSEYWPAESVERYRKAIAEVSGAAER